MLEIGLDEARGVALRDAELARQAERADAVDDAADFNFGLPCVGSIFLACPDRRDLVVRTSILLGLKQRSRGSSHSNKYFSFFPSERIFRQM